MKFLTGPSPVLSYRNRSLRLTPEGVLFIFLTLVVGGLAINTANNLLYLLMALMVTVIMVSGVLSEWCLKGIRLEHKMPGRLFAHEPATARWTVLNQKSFLPSYTLRVSAEYPHMACNEELFVARVLPGEAQSLGSAFSFGHRGFYKSPTYRLSTDFPFGLFEKALRLPGTQEVLVYPKLHRLWTVDETFALGGEERSSGKIGEGSSLYNLRHYQQGDNPKHIRWKVSARQAKLVVEEQEQERDPRVQIRLVNRAPAASPPVSEADFEEAVSLSASLAYGLLRKGYEVGLSTSEGEIAPKRGKAHLDRILYHLALVRLHSPQDPKKDAKAAGLTPPGRRSCQTLVILPWEDAAATESPRCRVITPSQWKKRLEEEQE